jgi:hypothetical protein
MDEIALRYLLLALRLGRHVPRFVESYFGPAELAEAVDAELLTPLAELHDESMQLAGMAAELTADAQADRRRRTWLAAQVAAMGMLARWIGGEEIGYVDLVEELYDIEVVLEPDATFATARRMLEGALPGPGSLRDRLATHDAEARVADDRVIPAVGRLAAGLRERARAQLWLPPNESVQLDEARQVPWDTSIRHLGSGRSAILINLDRPLTIASLGELVAHDAYPGRHTEAAVKDQLLVSTEHPELSLLATPSPQALVSEGMAGFGREVLMGDRELLVELERLARSLDGGPDLEAEVTVLRARRLMVPAVGNAAVALHRDGEPVEGVRAYLAEVALLADDRLDETMSRLADPVLRAEPFARIEGRRLVSEWLEEHGQTQGFGRLLAEQLTPGELRSELRPWPASASGTS